ncbi:LNX2-like protein [Mya arenaria]|uniref:LNX2-like protein n=1 Tax=Mya arenaria TaxID=6604 RepID=A0ABY7DY21_MYAAR|nr:LNX2-like protein [Mya arenaria]
MLDKLLVVCPNTDHCEEVLPRVDLEAHLAHRCRGTVTRCIRAGLGCTFRGPRSKNAVIKGEVTTIEIERDQIDLGISIVGGCDTPLVCVVVQEVFPDGAVSRDGRLQPGDQILEVPNGFAVLEGGLRVDDRVLEINGVDVAFSSQEHAAAIIQASPDRVQFVVSRTSRPRTPDLGWCRPATLGGLDAEMAAAVWPICRKSREILITIHKVLHESLGISIAGGAASPRGDTPIYVTNINPNGCLAKSEQVQRGDVLLAVNGANLLGLSHPEAVARIKANTRSNVVTLRIVEAPEACNGSGNFVPSWLFWQQLPNACKTVRTVTLLRGSAGGSLGFSVVGGADCPQGPLPVYVKCGDQIQSVNDVSLEHVAHSKAVHILKQATGAVSLRVVSWPGTVV